MDSPTFKAPLGLFASAVRWGITFDVQQASADTLPPR